MPRTTRETTAHLIEQESLLAEQAQRVLRAGKRGDGAKCDFLAKVGIDGFIAGFKTLRQLAGEEVYKGLEPAQLISGDQLLLDPFLELASEGKIPCNWEDHDAAFHVLGTLLSTKEVRVVVEASAKAARPLSLSDRVGVAGSIDLTTNAIQFVSLQSDPDMALLAAGMLHGQLCSMVDHAGLTDTFSQEGLYDVSHQQAAFISDLRK